MKTLSFLFLFILPLPLNAGEIFGSITENDKPVGEGIKVEITAPNKIVDSTTTDKFGSYRVFVKGKGKCTITVQYKDQVVSAELFSYNKSLRYDWILEAREGKYSLRRK